MHLRRIHPVTAARVRHEGKYRRNKRRNMPTGFRNCRWKVNGPAEALHFIHFKSVWIHMTAGLTSKEAVSGDSDKSYVYDFRQRGDKRERPHAAFAQHYGARSKSSCSRPVLGVNGREIPDILVEGSGFRCLIEAKVDPTLELTDRQRAGYQACLEGDGERHLAFLVPSDWMHTASAEQVQTLVPASVRVHTSYWRELIERLDTISVSLADDVLIGNTLLDMEVSTRTNDYSGTGIS